MKIVTTGTFRFRGKTYPGDTLLDLPDAVAAEAIDDGVADPVEESAPAVAGDAAPAEPVPDPAADAAPAETSAKKAKGAGS